MGCKAGAAAPLSLFYINDSPVWPSTQCKTKLVLSKTKICETQVEEGILKLPGVWCVAATPLSAFSAA